MKTYLYLKCIIFLMFCCSVNATSHDTQANNYLLKPTGSYGVGYQDVFLINTDICPDAFYKKSINEGDFSPANKQHCHEIALRIYYPSQNSLSQGDTYYAPYLTEQINWLAKKMNLSKQDIAKLNTVLNVKTYTFANSKSVTMQKFPIIVFIPGSGTPAQAYNNIISNLVSNGYIVVGVNSLFINGALQSENGYIVSPPDAYLDEDGRRENISDLKFVLEHLAEIEYKSNLQEQMDFNTVGLIGHSRGAMSIVNLLKNSKNNSGIKALIFMDPADKLGPENYPLPDLKVPTLVIWSIQLKMDWHGSSVPSKNGITVTLKPKNSAEDYSGHNNFMDSSTLQYHPAYQIPALQKLSKLEEFALGEGDGYEIATKLNNYMLTFLHHYLKPNIMSKPLDFKDEYK